jgi:hypothetical protein
VALRHGHDENFFEWSPASIVFATCGADWRPNDKLRLNAQYQLQSYDRRSDGSTVGVRKIPRLKAGYQLSRPVFLRVIGEYDAGHLARRLADRAADSDSRSLDRTLCASSGVRAQSLPRRCALLVSTDAGHAGFRRLQQHPGGTPRSAIR